jgi:short subunit dehydrogenase-like uncharacterized protein
MTDLDVVVFGATGFVGKLVAEHYARTRPAARIGLAGRSKEKLEQVRDAVDADWPLLVVDATDPHELVESAKVVCTTVGPYAKYGWPLAEACARTGTDYVDLTGETLFVRPLIDRFHDVAAESGARLVPSCGFDSVPSDLGVLLLAQQVAADGEGTLRDVTLVCSLKGGVSGGTVDSLRTHVDGVRADPAAAALVDDPYSLSPDRDREPDLGKQPDRGPARREPDGRWTAPFVMGQYNSRVVRRSNALTDWSYGRELRYTERMYVGGGPLAPLTAQAGAAFLAVAEPAMGSRLLRPLLDRVLPSPGEGPSAKLRETGWFRMDLRATTTTGARYRGVVAGKGDPGYAATAVMIGESALCLALDDVPAAGGVLTPATAMGAQLAERLRRAGMELSVTRE